MPTAARPISITCAATISITAPTWPLMWTTCRSICRRHAHGQGYTDLNWLIPETVSGLEVRKGPYFADVGDFANAGDLHVVVARQRRAEHRVDDRRQLRLRQISHFGLDQGSAAARCSMPANSTPITVRGPRPTTCASSTGLLRYSQGTATDGFSATAMAYANTWNSTDQVALRAMTTGQIGLYGELDPTDGGDTSRFSLSARMAQSDRRRIVEGQCLSRQIRAGPVQQFHLAPRRSIRRQRRSVPSARRPHLRRRRRLAHHRRFAVRPADRDRVRRANPLRRHRSRTEQHGAAPVAVEYPRSTMSTRAMSAFMPRTRCIGPIGCAPPPAGAAIISTHR